MLCAGSTAYQPSCVLTAADALLSVLQKMVQVGLWEVALLAAVCFTSASTGGAVSVAHIAILLYRISCVQNWHGCLP